MVIKVYSTPTCPWCKKVKAFLKENDVEFENVDVSSDHAAVKEMIEKSKQMGVPVVDVDGEIVIGFDKEKLKGLLKIDG